MGRPMPPTGPRRLPGRGRHRVTRLVLLGACAWLAAGAPPAAGRQETRPRIFPDVTDRDVVEYHAVVSNYLAGRRDAATAVFAWRPERLGAVVRAIEPPGSSEVPWDPRGLAAAALMHTDAALQPVSAGDGNTAMHLQFAGALLAKGSPELDPLASRWYVAMARVLSHRTWVAEAERLLEMGRKRLPGDPAVLCESGWSPEQRATERTVAASDTGPVAGVSEWVVAAFSERRLAELRRAAGWFEQGVHRGSTDVLCRLHLGRVWSLLGRYEQSDPLLEALARGDDRAVAYLASMFLGASAERRGDLGAAEQHYRAAVATFEPGQSAHLALSAVLLARGHVAESNALVNAVLEAPEDGRREPWWWYLHVPRFVVRGELDEIRAEVLR